MKFAISLINNLAIWEHRICLYYCSSGPSAYQFSNLSLLRMINEKYLHVCKNACAQLAFVQASAFCIMCDILSYSFTINSQIGTCSLNYFYSNSWYVFVSDTISSDLFLGAAILFWRSLKSPCCIEAWTHSLSSKTSNTEGVLKIVIC